jgi:hypothetical protein
MRIATAAALALVTVLLALAGAAFLFAALYLWLATLMTPASAALVTGIVVLVGAAVVALIGRLLIGVRRVASVAPLAGAGRLDMAALMGSELGVAGTAWLREHLPQVALAAAGAGFLLGVSPRLRAALWRQLR